MKKIILLRKKEESLKRFHPWVFSGAIAKLPKDIKEGELVEVESNDGSFLGIGHYQIGSIAVRILSFKKREIDEDFWRERILAAYKVRETLGLTTNPQNDTYRLVHGEGDNLPGLVIDVYGKSAVVQACTTKGRR